MKAHVQKQSQPQQKAAPHSSRLMIATPIVHEVLRSPGQPLDASTRGLMESRFGHDFSKVRVHTDGRAAKAASAIDARAFTANRNIVFGAGEFAPQSESGRWLLSHELTHVAQRAGGSDSPLAAGDALSMSDTSDHAEGEANHVAREIMMGGIAPRLSSQTSDAVIHRQPKTTDTQPTEASAKKEGESTQPEDGGEQVFLLIAPLMDKTYSNQPLPTEDEKPEAAHSFGRFDKYDPAAVIDCFAIVGKLTDEGRKYLESEAGMSLLAVLKRMPEGHALRLFAENWQAPEPVITRAQWRANKRLAKFQKAFGQKGGKAVYKILDDKTSDKELGGYAKGGVKSAVDPIVKDRKEKIEAHEKQNDPNYTSEMATRDKADLDKIQEIVAGMEDDLLELRPVKEIFERARNVVMNPYVLEGLLLALVNPTASNLPFAVDKPLLSPAEYLIKEGKNLLDEFMNENAEQKLPLSFGTGDNMFQGKAEVDTYPLVPGNALSGATPLKFDTVKKLGGDITGRFGGKEHPLTITANDEFMLKQPGVADPTVASSKGGVEISSENKQTKESFKGLADYEFKPGVLKITSSQKFSGKDEFITFSEGYAVDQNGTRTTFGVDMKSSIFTQHFNLNLPRNASNQPVDETANIGLGVDFLKHETKDSKTLSLDADITMNLAGQDYVKALSSFLEYKDPKQFLDAAIGYQRERSGQINKEDFSLALKKTWDDVTVYLGGSLGLNEGKPVGGNVLAGTEVKFGSKSKYGVFAEGEYNKTGLPGSSNIFTGTTGIVRDKLRLGAYLSNDPANQFGVKATLPLNPLDYAKRKR